jgi:hypothetical protein
MYEEDEMVKTRKTRTVGMNPRNYGGCDVCFTQADYQVQISTPNGRSYRTCGFLCREHKTTENINVSVEMATAYLDGK